MTAVNWRRVAIVVGGGVVLTALAYAGMLVFGPPVLAAFDTGEPLPLATELAYAYARVLFFPTDPLHRVIGAPIGIRLALELLNATAWSALAYVVVVKVRKGGEGRSAP